MILGPGPADDVVELALKRLRPLVLLVLPPGLLRKVPLALDVTILQLIRPCANLP